MALHHFVLIAYPMSILVAVAICAFGIAKRPKYKPQSKFYTESGLSTHHLRLGLYILAGLALAYFLPAYLYGGRSLMGGGETEDHLWVVFEFLGVTGSLIGLWLLLVLSGSWIIGLAFALRSTLLGVSASLLYLCGGVLTLHTGAEMVLLMMMAGS